MTFLPIVERELRLAARRRGTFWLRVAAAVIALILAGGFLMIKAASAGGRMPLGGMLFSTLTWLSLAGALSAGLFFTSDCLSEEKREGTLGFLFLTDLRGYDVVLGKLLATSLRCGFAFLAIYPVLAITQLMGGVEAGLFWKTILALTHALFFSLATGMFVSAISRDGQKALSGTLGLLMFFLIAGPAVDSVLAWARQPAFGLRFSWTSPGYVFTVAGSWGGTFWRALLTSQAVAWLMLGLSCVLIPRNWQQKSRSTSPALLHASYWWRYGGTKRREQLRRKLLDVNPVLWLASRERWQGLMVWVLAALLIGAFIAMFVFHAPSDFWAVWNFIGAGMSLILYLWMASQASRFFAEARRTGLTELLLAAPMNTREIVQGPWQALVRLFAWPVGICLAVSFMTQLFNSFGGGFRPTMSGVATGVPSGWLIGVSALAGTLVTLANLAALGWFGLWMGLTSKNARFATLKTFLFVQVVPWFVMAMAAGMMMPLFMLGGIPMGSPASSNTLMFWYPLASLALTTGLSLAKDFFFIGWARRKLLRDFRERATRAIAPIHVSQVRTLPPRLAAKP